MDFSNDGRAQARLAFEQVCFGFGGKIFIENLTFEAAPGEMIGLIGANGAGKSTLLRLAAGLLKPWTGTVRVGGRPLAEHTDRERAGRLAYLPQSLDVHLPFRVAELVRMGNYPRMSAPRLSPEEALRIVGLERKGQAQLGQLSGGELRRAFIAMTLVQGAGCLLLDEPLAGLDLKYQAELLRLLREIVESSGVTVLMSLHDMAATLRFDRLLALKAGHLMAQGPAPAVLTESLMARLFDLAEHDAALFATGPHRT
ncbi:ABC transporter ATP-binding protein [Geoalkalibacter halelectricus]|uniref:ABC transporter ATP-binding protein n=1 Tax=Geoalkalibacter halelectricus TaxID=2847045 RepID=A0ABY5ZIX6_9BACT|nr:ABC transporter ATP-binding protein [Geoalkalibacter halelectricus]MDO3376837.1 ABC transporter ATP-binding protein [Geoalkalibacter halelectricus]UWZ79097.1 ABC transporter ATP-binding protein [Geoalkalibacter halelectricus]